MWRRAPTGYVAGGQYHDEACWGKEALLARTTCRAWSSCPEKGVLTAIGRDHTLATALADLIDNSIDAHADTVTIRLVTTDSLLHTVRVRDNGDGMSGDELQLAMRLGERREYAATDHGHFGMGLKAAFPQSIANSDRVHLGRG